MGKNKGKLKEAYEKRQAELAMERGYQRLKFWLPREVDPRIKKAKFRNYLLDQNYNRPPIRPERFISGVLELRTKGQNLTIYEILLLIHLERYEFFTIKHLDELGFYTRPDSKPKRLYRYFWDIICNLQAKGLIWQPIRDWDLSDEEFKQRFGEAANRHQYKRRYALNSAGKLLMDRFYDAVKD